MRPVRPVFRALCEHLALPSGDDGPVLSCALARLGFELSGSGHKVFPAQFEHEGERGDGKFLAKRLIGREKIYFELLL